MYEEVVKKLRRCGQFKCRGCEYEDVTSCRVRLNEDAARAIEELNRALDWIPCSERLPPLFYETYLVSLAWGGVGTMVFKDTGFHNYGSFSPVPIETVTAWMPLPEPYKPAEEEKNVRGCEYCHEDSDGYVRPIEKNCHAFVRKGRHVCPVCERKFTYLGGGMV